MERGSLLEITSTALTVPIWGCASDEADLGEEAGELGDDGSDAIRRLDAEIEENVREASREMGRPRRGGRR